MVERNSPYTTPIKVHYVNPQSPAENDYEDGDYEDNVDAAEDDALETFTTLKDHTVSSIEQIGSVTDVAIDERDSLPGWPASTLDFVPIVVDVTHEAEDEDAIRAAIQERLTDGGEHEIIDVFIVQPELP